jgi:hypothetical protein
MQQEVFEVLAGARSLEDLRKIEPKARNVLQEIFGWARLCHSRGAGHSPKV